MKILVDLNLSPDWCRALAARGHACVHWSAVGAPEAPDAVLLEWARQHGYVVLTHDLDFGAILAASRAAAPSVVQLRAQDLLSAELQQRLLALLQEHEAVIEAGALMVLDETRVRVRILPLARRGEEQDRPPPLPSGLSQTP